MKTDVAKVTIEAQGLIKFRVTQMSDNQHKIKTAENYDMFTIHIHTEIHITKKQLHNYEYSYLFINKKNCIYT